MGCPWDVKKTHHYWDGITISSRWNSLKKISFSYSSCKPLYWMGYYPLLGWDNHSVNIYIYYDMIADASSLISAPFVIFGSGFRCTLKWLTPVFNFLPNFVPRNVPGVGHRRCASCLSQWLELIESHWLNSVG